MLFKMCTMAGYGGAWGERENLTSGNWSDGEAVNHDAE